MDKIVVDKKCMKDQVRLYKNDIFFTIYILTTFFLGTSVKSFLDLPTFDEGVISSIHYLSLPFLLLAFFNSRKAKMMTSERMVVFASLLFFVINRFILGKSASLGLSISIIYEPIGVLLLLLGFSYNPKVLRKIILIFFIVECGTAVFEALFKVIVFAQGKSIYEIGEFGRVSIRAYSLHGHPLQNAFLVCITSVAILYSNLNIRHRYMLFFLGVAAIFCFNTRSSILILTFALVVRLYFDFKKSFWNFSIIAFIIIIPFFFYAIPYMIETGFGDRFFILIDEEDGSSMARFMLIEMFLKMDFHSQILGIDVLTLKTIMNRYGFVAIENSILNVVLAWGIIMGVIYYISLYKMFWRLKSEKKIFFMIILVFSLLLNVNNAILTATPIIPITFFLIYAFQPNRILKKESGLPI